MIILPTPEPLEYRRLKSDNNIDASTSKLEKIHRLACFQSRDYKWLKNVVVVIFGSWYN